MKKIVASVLVFCCIILSFLCIINYYHTWLKHVIIKAIEKNTEYSASLGNVRIELPNKLILNSLYLRSRDLSTSSFRGNPHEENLSHQLYIKKAIIIFSLNEKFRLRLKKIIVTKPILSINCKNLKDLPQYIVSTLKDNEDLYDIHPFDINIKSAKLNIFASSIKSALVFDKIFLNYSLYKKEGNFKFCPSKNTLVFGKISNNNISMNISSKDITYLAKLLSLKNIYSVDLKRENIKGRLNITLINDSFKYNGHIRVEDIKFFLKTKNYIYIKAAHFMVNNDLFILKCSAVYKNIPFKTHASFRNLNNIKVAINTDNLVLDNNINNNLPIDIGEITLISSFDGYLIDRRRLEGRVIFLGLQEGKNLFKVKTQLLYKNNYLYLSGIKTQDTDINPLYLRMYLKDAQIQYLDAYADKVLFRNFEVTGRLTYNNKDEKKFSLKIKPLYHFYEVSLVDINYLDNKLCVRMTQTEDNWLNMVIKKEIDKPSVITVVSIFKDFKINNNLFISGHINSQLEGDLNSGVGQIRIEDIRINNERIRNLVYKINYSDSRISLVSTTNLPNLYFDIKNLITARNINLEVYYGDILKTYIYICLRDDNKIHTSIHSEVYKNEYCKVAEANFSGDILLDQNYASLFIKNIKTQNFIFKDGKLNINLSRDNKLIFSCENIEFINTIYTQAHGKFNLKADLEDNNLNFNANIVYLWQGNKNNIKISEAILTGDILNIKSAQIFQNNDTNSCLKITDLCYKIPDRKITSQAKASNFQLGKYFINGDYLLTGILKDIYSKEFEFVCKINNLNINNNDFVLRDGNLYISSKEDGVQARLVCRIIHVNDYIFKNPNISILLKGEEMTGVSNSPMEINLGFLSAKNSHIYFKFTKLKHRLADLFISLKIKDARFTSPFEYYHNQKSKKTLVFQGINKLIIEFIADENVYYHTAYLETWIEKGSYMKVYKDGDSKYNRFSGEIMSKRGRLNYFGRYFDVVGASLSIKEVDKLPYLKLLAYGRSKDAQRLVLSYDGKLFAEKVKLTAGSYGDRDFVPSNKAAIFLGLDIQAVETMKVEELFTLGIAKILGYRVSRVMEPIERIASKLLDVNLRITLPFEDIYKKQYSPVAFELSKYINKDLYMNLLVDVNPAAKKYYLQRNTLLVEYYMTKNTVLEYKFEKSFEESSFYEISIRKTFKF